MAAKFILKKGDQNSFEITANDEFWGIEKLITYNPEEKKPGSYSIVVQALNTEEMLYERDNLTITESIMLLRLISENKKSDPDTVVKNDSDPFSFWRRRSVKWFIGFFMGFAVLSLLLKFRDYGKMNTAPAAFNIFINTVLLICLSFGIWIFYFRNNNKSEGEDQ